MAHLIIQPNGWAAAKGYANGVLSENGTLYVGGQILSTRYWKSVLRPRKKVKRHKCASMKSKMTRATC